MKLELIKETDLKGNILYSLEKDGRYIDGTATGYLDKAERIFQLVLDGNTKTKEILKSQEYEG